MEGNTLKMTIENQYMEVSLTMKDSKDTLETYYDLCYQGAMALGYDEKTVQEYFAPELAAV